MRKCVNAEHLEGYVYQHSLTVKQVKNEQSKNFGQDFISGDLEIAVDDVSAEILHRLICKVKQEDPNE